MVSSDERHRSSARTNTLLWCVLGVCLSGCQAASLSRTLVQETTKQHSPDQAPFAESMRAWSVNAALPPSDLHTPGQGDQRVRNNQSEMIEYRTGQFQPTSSNSENRNSGNRLPRLMPPEFGDPVRSHDGSFDQRRPSHQASYPEKNSSRRVQSRVAQTGFDIEYPRVNSVGAGFVNDQTNQQRNTLPSLIRPGGKFERRRPVQTRIAQQPAVNRVPTSAPTTQADRANTSRTPSEVNLKGSKFLWKSDDFQVPDRPSRANPKYDFLFQDIDQHSESVTSIQPDDPNARPISMAEVILHTLQNNPHILVSQFKPEASVFEPEIERAQFDPVFRIGGQWGRADTLVGSVLDGQGVGTGSVENDSFGVASGLTDIVQLSQKLTSGGVADVGWTTEYRYSNPAGSFLTLNPQQSSALSVRLNQPLFQGAGNRFNGLTIEIAKTTYHGTFFEFESKVNKVIKNVVLDYWELYAAYSDVRKYEQSVIEAKTTWLKEIEKKRLGASSLPDVAQALENYEFNRHDLASSRRRFITYELRLRERMGLSAADGKTLVPTTVPVVQLSVPDWESSIDTALNSRPEILSQKKNVEAKELEYELKENGLSPDIDAYASYSLTGLGNNFHDSAGGVTDNEHTTWTMGFKYERPIFKRQATAELDKKLVELLQEKAILRQVEFSVTHELRSIYAEITTARDMFDALDRRLRASEVRKEVSKVLFDQGKMSLDLYLRIQSAYVHTTLDRDEAYIRFNQALSNWEYAKGTILANADIHLRSEDE
jgi:outer membrane protein TolC